MAIFLLIGSRRRTGPRSQSLSIAADLRREGHKNVKVIVVAKLGVWTAMAFVLRTSPACFLSTGFLPDVVCWITSFFTKHRYITYVRCDFKQDYASKFGKWVGAVLAKTHFIVIKRFHKILCVSNQIYNMLPTKTKTRAAFVPNPLRSPLKNISRSDVLSRRRKLGFVGSNLPRKNLGKILEFVETYGDELKITLTIFGVEGESTRLDRIQYRGFRPKQEIYSSIGTLILLSSSEGTPNVVLEALSYGIPIVLSDIEPHRDLASEFVGWPIHLCATNDALSIRAAFDASLNYTHNPRLQIPMLYTPQFRTSVLFEMLQ